MAMSDDQLCFGVFWWLVRLVACFCCQEIEDAKPDSDPTKLEVKAAKFIPQFAASNGALQVPRKVEKYRL